MIRSLTPRTYDLCRLSQRVLNLNDNPFRPRTSPHFLPSRNNNCTFELRLPSKPSYNFGSTSRPGKPATSPYIRLLRWHLPIGAMLLYWPTAWGVSLGSPGLPSVFLLSLFLIGAWTSRSAGCIINDYFDREFDRKVQRTKTRPLASGQVTTKQAGVLLFLNLLGGLFVLANLPRSALFTAISFVALAAVYPLAKRYTNYPQAVLGMGYNSGIIIGYLTAAGLTGVPASGFSYAIVPMYLSGIAWTMIYDTVYAYQVFFILSRDLQDDLKIGIKSTAVTWRDKNPKQIMEKIGYVIVMCHLLLPFFDVDFMYSTPLMVACDTYLIWQLKKLDLSNRQKCAEFFKQNNKYGLAIFICLLLMNLTKAYRSLCDRRVEGHFEKEEVQVQKQNK